MSTDADSLGQDLTRSYALGPLLGQGAFGAVHRAREVATGREVAVKLLAPTRQGAAVDRFLREATVAASLEHPGIVRVHAVGRHGGRLAIVYELVDGEPFAAAIRTRSLRGRAELVRDAARAVGHAHRSGVVHRDLKPDNLLVGRDGRLRVADFGLAWFEGADRLTRTGAVVGTPHYMAPELFDGRTPAGPSSDVWALGVTLYEALTGRLPFDGADLMLLVARLQHATVTPPRQVDPSVDPSLEAVCLRALERDPARRFPDGEALAAALDDALAGRAREDRRGRGPWVAAAALLLVLVASAFVVTSRGAPPAPASTPGRIGARTTPAPATSPADEPLRDRQLVRARTARWALWVDARRVVTGGADDDVRLLDAATGDEVRSWPLRARTADRLGPGRLALGGSEGLFVLAVEAPDPPSRLGQVDEVEQVACAEGSGRLAVIGRGRGVRLEAFLVEADGATRAVSFPTPGLTPIAVALEPDGSTLAFALRDPNFTPVTTEEQAWETPEGPLGRFDVAADGAVTFRDSVLLPGTTVALRFSDPGDLLLAGTTTGQIGLIPRVAAEMEDHLRPPGFAGNAHEAAVRAIAISVDGRQVFSAADHPAGFELEVWDLERRAVLATFTGAGRAIGLDLSPDGRAVVIGTTNGGVHLRVVDDAP